MKKSHRNIMILILIVILAAGIAGFSLFRMVSGSTPRITVVTKTDIQVAEFWEIAERGIRQAALDYEVDLNIVGVEAETMIDEQIALTQDVIAQKPDVLVLVSTDYNRMVDVAEAAVKAGIKLITLDSDVNTTVQSCYVGSDNYEIGCSMGRLLVQQKPEGGKVAILAHGNSSSGIDRVKGAWDILKETKGFELVGIYDCYNDSAKAQTYTAELLEQHKDLAAIICSNEVCHIGAADHVSQMGKEQAVTLIGCDSSKTQIRYLEQDVIQGIIIQQPYNMGYMALKSAALLARGESLPNQILIPCVTITQENMYDLENQKLLFPVEAD